MKTLFIDYNWDKSWMPLYRSVFEPGVFMWNGYNESPIKDPDIVMSMWGDRDFTGLFPKARHAMFMRRFELFYSDWKSYNWDAIDFLFCCNPWIASVAAGQITSKTAVAYVRNPIDTSGWTYKKRENGTELGMVCRVHHVKNLPLAAQIMVELPKQYTLHIAGKIDHPDILPYMQGLGERVKFYNNIPRKDLDSWWEDKNYCLSTSISEGDPMNVLEAMAKGIKPIIHRWPGAYEMYDDTFVTVKRAVFDIMRGDYNSAKYLESVKKNNSVSNIDEIYKMVTA